MYTKQCTGGTADNVMSHNLCLAQSSLHIDFNADRRPPLFWHLRGCEEDDPTRPVCRRRNGGSRQTAALISQKKKLERRAQALVRAKRVRSGWSYVHSSWGKPRRIGWGATAVSIFEVNKDDQAQI